MALGCQERQGPWCLPKFDPVGDASACGAHLATRGHCHLLRPSSHLVQPRSSTLPLSCSWAALLKKSLDHFPRARHHTTPPRLTTALPAASPQVPAPSPLTLSPWRGAGVSCRDTAAAPPDPPYLPAAWGRGLRGTAGGSGTAPPPAPHVGDPATATPRHRHRRHRAAGRGGHPRRHRRLPGLLLRAPGSPHAQLQAEEERGGEQAEAESGAPPERPLLGHGVGGCPGRRCRPPAPPQGSCPRRAGPRGRRRRNLGVPAPSGAGRGGAGMALSRPGPARRGLRDTAVLARRRPEGRSAPRRGNPGTNVRPRRCAATGACQRAWESTQAPALTMVSVC